MFLHPFHSHSQQSFLRHLLLPLCKFKLSHYQNVRLIIATL
jgi:hypothetical protein